MPLTGQDRDAHARRMLEHGEAVRRQSGEGERRDFLDAIARLAVLERELTPEALWKALWAFMRSADLRGGTTRTR